MFVVSYPAGKAGGGVGVAKKVDGSRDIHVSEGWLASG
jgi:hypothetical protein